MLEVKISSTSSTRQAFVSTLESSPLRDNDVVVDPHDLESILLKFILRDQFCIKLLQFRS